MASWLAAAQHVFEHGAAQRVDLDTGHLVPPGRKRRGRVVLLDYFTASTLVQVHKALKPDSQATFEAMDLRAAQAAAFTIARRFGK